jgi:hypothetical protein
MERNVEEMERNVEEMERNVEEICLLNASRLGYHRITISYVRDLGGAI